jgi:hypothetical protein
MDADPVASTAMCEVAQAGIREICIECPSARLVAWMHIFVYESPHKLRIFDVEFLLANNYVDISAYKADNET